jgi:hypothetical protein
MTTRTPTRNDEVAALVQATRLTHPEVAAALSRTLRRTLNPYVIGRMISGVRAVKADEMDALRVLAQGSTDAPASRENIAPQLTEGAHFVPLYALPATPGAVFKIDEEGRVGASPIHPSQRGYRAAFNFIQPDDRLGERIRRGDVGHAVRDLPPLPGQPVLIERQDGEAFARVYLREDARTIFVKAMKPKEEEERVARLDIKGLHRVTGVTFGGA